MKHAGFKQHSFDRCLYYHLGADGSLDCIMIVHVDDFMATYSESFSVSVLESLFTWGSVTHVSPDTPGEYRGKEVTMVQDGDKLYYKITQEKFLATLQSGKIKKSRASAEDKRLNDDERKEFRSVCGCLQWLSGQTRPDLCAVTSLVRRGTEGEVSDLKQLYDALEFAKSTKDKGIVFLDIPINRASVVVTFADSSWANADQLKSQFGVLVMVCPPQVSEKTCFGHLFDWKSGRSPRVCRSTLAAEACAADEGADRGSFLNLVLSELLYLKPAYKGAQRLNAMLCTDARSLYDSLISENPGLSDKRSMIQVRSVQQTFLPRSIRWVPTNLQHSDGLTKVDDELRFRLLEWCQKPWAQLVEEHKPV